MCSVLHVAVQNRYEKLLSYTESWPPCLPFTVPKHLPDKLRRLYHITLAFTDTLFLKHNNLLFSNLLTLKHGTDRLFRNAIK